MMFTLGSSLLGSKKMQRPSDNWKKLHLAAIERTKRTVIDPLLPLYQLHFCICTVYLAGFMYFKFFELSSVFNILNASFLIAAAIAGLLVPVITGSVLSLHFAQRRIEKLMLGEHH
jgi:hypothetical protein